ncbi:MAG: hypothetical protein AAF438_20005, partial [Pseudomonadota bacterium]
LVGNTGVILILFTYMMLQLEKMEATSYVYSGLNAAGAVLILYSLLHDFNLSSFVIEICWLVISIVGMLRQYVKPT